MVPESNSTLVLAASPHTRTQLGAGGLEQETMTLNINADSVSKKDDVYLLESLKT